MRVIQVAHRFPPHPGGIEYHVMELSEFLVERGVEVLVLTTTPEPYPGNLPFRVYRFKPLAEPLRNPISFKLVLQFRKLARESIAHLHSPYTFSTLLTYPFAEKAVITLHGRPYYGGVFRYLAKVHEKVSITLTKGAHFISLTELGASYLKAMGIPEERIHVIPNFVNIERLQSLAKGVEGGHAYDLLYVGGLVEAKGLDQLVRDLSELEMSLAIIGKGPLREKLEELAKGLGVRVHFLGALPREKVIRAYLSARAVILPSRSEGFPTVVLEALSLGRPVILSDIEVHRRLFKDVALLYRPGNPSSLKEAILSLDSFSPEKAVKFVKENYDIRVVGSRVLSLYKSIWE